MPRLQVGVDVGGTFTDVIVQDLQTSKLVLSKAFSTPDDPMRGIMEGTRQALDDIGADFGDIIAVRHGTTIGTNATLERRGAKAALIITKGFRDILHVGRQARPSLYNLRARYAPPLVPRHLTFELDERTEWDGTEIKPVVESALEDIAAKLRAENIAAVAVCLLHSYVNDSHEVKVKEVLERLLPDIPISISSDICPQIGEYERASTTASNSYVTPPIKRYVAGLSRELRQFKEDCQLHIMQSNGGVMGPQVAVERSVHTLLSGPAGGLIGAHHFARMLNAPNLITLDVGGTSADVGVVIEGEVQSTREGRIAGLPIRIPFLDIHTVGAGGGSIAWIDPGGALKVGPHSAGSVPGPVCYGRGGDQPTVTDANVVLGYIGPETRLGGHAKVDVAAAEASIKCSIADPLGLSVLDAASGMIEIANVVMIRAIRVLTVERGLNPQDFALLAFGGAGPLHAPALARALSIDRVLVPPFAGGLSALGMLVADVRHDFVQTYIERTDSITSGKLTGLLDELKQQALRVMSLEGFKQDAVVLTRWIEMRYAGQAHDLKIRITSDNVLENPTAELPEFLNEAHRQRYGFAFEHEQSEIVQVGLSASAMIQPFVMQKHDARSASNSAPQCRTVRFDGKAVPADIFHRDVLRPDERITGPAVIEAKDATILVPPGNRAWMDPYGVVHVES